MEGGLKGRREGWRGILPTSFFFFAKLTVQWMFPGVTYKQYHMSVT